MPVRRAHAHRAGGDARARLSAQRTDPLDTRAVSRNRALRSQRGGGRMSRPVDYELYELGDVTLQHGATLRGCKLAYKTYGELAPDKGNAIVYPTWYSGRH